MSSQLIAGVAKRALSQHHRDGSSRSTAVLLARTFQSSSPKSGLVGSASRTSRTKANLAKPSSSSNQTSSSRSQALHSSAPQEKSLAAGDVQLLSATTTVRSVPMPTPEQLKAVFISSAVPMIGFGFMDNFIMIQAGSYIDATLGVTLGLATMTAAAMGQVVSDVSGVLFGGTVERLANSIGWARAPSLTLAQRQLPICRNLAMAGSVLGVALGCLLGASSLFFLPEDASKDAQARGLELQEIVSSMLVSAQQEGDDGLRCKEVAIYVSPTSGFASRAGKRHAGTTTLCDLNDEGDDSLVSRCANTRRTLAVDDAGAMAAVECGGESVLYAPIVDQNDNALGVLAFRSKVVDEQQHSSETSFTAEDERTARMMARHVAIFMERIATTRN